MQDVQQVRHLYVVLRQTLSKGTDVGRETAQALAGGLSGNFIIFTHLFFLILVIFCTTEDKQPLEMSLILTVLDIFICRNNDTTTDTC